jgi:ATP-binding cassette subfamily B protein
MVNNFPIYIQTDAMDCGATCLKMISKHYGVEFSINDLRSLTYTSRSGTSLYGISNAAEKLGFHTLSVKVSIDQLLNEIPLPCISHWNQNHFIVIYKVKNGKVYVADPGFGKLKYDEKEFLKNWSNQDSDLGHLLLIEPTVNLNPNYFLGSKNSNKGASFSTVFNHLLKYKLLLLQLFIGLFVGSLLQLVFPFLTQSIIDIGIQNDDINFIYLILFAQLLFFFGKVSIEIIRNWILMHISSRVNISLVSDFFIKLMNLPISYFDVKMTGDTIQRINDHQRIENFLTGTSISAIFSLFNLIVFCIVLAYYNSLLLIVFGIGSILYVLWTLFFLKRRAIIDYKKFQQNSKNQSKIIELLNGMQEIKLNNAEKQKRWEWESLQISLFKINSKGLALAQFQNTGSSFINELKNIILTFIAAKLVISGSITLGMMLSISYIIGQLNLPLNEMVNFLLNYHDAKLSFNRLDEIHQLRDEYDERNELIEVENLYSDIIVKDLSYKYDKLSSNNVLNNINLSIKRNSIIAIVGSSGSGKTTLMKLLLKFYTPDNGTICLGDQNLEYIDPVLWRERCGVVQQDGYIFSDTILNNIAVGVEKIDMIKINTAIRIANIYEFINTLPLKLNTKIGLEGVGLSMGQKQRILIARSIYKNPDFLFFDEATSALDATNEAVINKNLQEVFTNKTVFIIAHRLSTVKNADNIIVLENGTIVESGKHNELVDLKGVYFELIKNQLELGN